MKNCLLFLFVCQVCMACGPEKISVNDYVKWIETPANGFVVEAQPEGQAVSLLYKPATYIALMEQRGQEFDPDLQREREKELESMYYFTLRIGVNEKATVEATYFTDAFQEDLYLVVEKDTLPCAMYHYEPHHGLSAFHTMVLGFEKPTTTSLTADPAFYISGAALGMDNVVLPLSKTAFNYPPQLIYP